MGVRLKDKVAVVTGGGSGIGQAICVLFAEEGASVCFGDLNEEGSAETVRQIEEAGGAAHFVVADVGEESECKRLVDEAVNTFGGLNVLVNNAARFITKGADATPQDWDTMMRTNVYGYAFTARFAIGEMRKTAGGTIVNVASMSSLIAQPESWTYNATKGAVAQLTRCMAMDLAPDNIRVNAVCPGVVWTAGAARNAKEWGMTKQEAFETWGVHQLIRRPADPREIAYPVLFLACEESSFVTGSLLVADAGYTAQ